VRSNFENAAMDTPLGIDEVVQRTGLSAHTLRYYERIGLIAPVSRAPGGQRRYAVSDLDWIAFLLRLRDTRMPVAQMQVFARLRAEGDRTVPERRALLEAHLADVEDAMQAMQRAAAVLATKIKHYRAAEKAVRHLEKAA
jgi:DNA-binding transcriptional MerR regulator